MLHVLTGQQVAILAKISHFAQERWSYFPVREIQTPKVANLQYYYKTFFAMALDGFTTPSSPSRLQACI